MPPKGISKEIKDQIVAAIRAGETGVAVAKRFGISGGMVTKTLRQYGVASQAVIPEDIEQKVVEMCLSGSSGRAVADELGVSSSSVSNVLRKHGVATKTGRPPSKELNHAAFDTLTPAACYWIGFLFADGTVVDNGDGAPQIALGLAEKDRGQIEKFRAFLGSTHAITENLVKTKFPDGSGKPRRSVSFRVRSRQLVEALRRLGFAAKGPDRTPTDIIAHSVDFWRGCIDGDGTVRIVEDHHGYDYKYASLILFGHMPLLEKYQAFLMSNGVLANITDTASGIFQVRIMGAGAYATIRLLYEGTTVALERKLESARAVLLQAVPRERKGRG